MLLVTGANGFVGTNLVKKLLKDGYSVRVFDRDIQDAKKKFPKADIIKGDLTDRDKLKEAAKKVDKVIHLAGMISYTAPESELYRINTHGTNNVLNACKNANKFIFASSVSVFGYSKDIISEKLNPNPSNAYGRSKLHAEIAIKDSKIPHVFLRMAPIYGAGSFFWIKALKVIDKGFPVPNVSNMIHFLHISNAVQAFVNSLKKGSGPYVIADDNRIKFTEFTENLAIGMGTKQKLWPSWLVFFLARLKGFSRELDIFCKEREYDISKAKKDLGYEPKADTEKEIQKMGQWYIKLKKQGKL